MARWTGTRPTTTASCPTEKAANWCLEQGQGFLANSPQLTCGTWPLNIGEDVSLTGQEKIWFLDFELRRK